MQSTRCIVYVQQLPNGWDNKHERNWNFLSHFLSFLFFLFLLLGTYLVACVFSSLFVLFRSLCQLVCFQICLYYFALCASLCVFKSVCTILFFVLLVVRTIFVICWSWLPRQGYCVQIHFRVQQLNGFWPLGNRFIFI